MLLRGARGGRSRRLTIAAFEGVHGNVLVIGFGRFGQLVNQVLLAEGVDVTVIDNDVERIQQRRAASASRSITATARGSTCCARPAPTRRG